MKVLYIIKTNNGAKWAFDQVKNMIEFGVEFIVVLPKKNGGMAESYKNLGITIIEEDFSIPIKNLWKIFEKIKVIRKVIKKEKPDLIHCHFVTNILMLRIALGNKYKIPRIFQVPGPLHLENIIFRSLDIYTANEYDYWVPTCKKSQEIYLKNGVELRRCQLGYYGGYGGEEINNYKKTNKLRKEFNINDNVKLIGMVSYFYKPKYYLFQSRGIKGHEDYIDAMKIVLDKYPNVLGIIIGGPWQGATKYMEKVKEYSKKKCGRKIIFTGLRNDIKEIYRDLDIVVHPSISENLGGAAESLAAGVLTITTNVGGFPDIVCDGETGYLTNPKSPESIAEKILFALENNDKENLIVKKGLEKVRTLLDIDSTSKKIYDIYLNLYEVNSK